MNEKEATKDEIPQGSASPVDRLVSIFDDLNDEESCKKQLDLWVKGAPYHNTVRDECCPDFSCCNGRIAPSSERERFAKACAENDEYTKMEMLGMFLGNAFSEEEIYVAGTDIPSEC